MAYKWDIVVDIQVSAASIVIKVLAPTPHQFERAIVRNTEIPTEKLLPSGERYIV